MINYEIYLKYTNQEDNKQTKLKYLKNYLQYVKIQNMYNKGGKVR